MFSFLFKQGGEDLKVSVHAEGLINDGLEGGQVETELRGLHVAGDKVWKEGRFY